MSVGTCAYSFDPVAWEEEHGRSAALDERWSCPREAEGETDRCRFHLSPARRAELGIDDESVCESLVSELATGEASSLGFVGAEFGTIDVSHRVLDRVTNHPIDLRHVTVYGEFLAEQTVLRQPLLMDEIRVEGAADFTDAEFGEDVSAERATFRGDAVFDGTDFEDSARFGGSTFARPASFDRVRFGDVADFYRARFRAPCSFEESAWRGACLFQRAAFRSDVTFTASRFHARTDFRTVQFGGTSRFNRCEFEDAAVFMNCAFAAEALFKKASFAQPAHYQNADFDSEASFTETEFGDKAKFQFATFDGEAVLSYIRFGGATYFKAVDFNSYASFYKSTFDRLGDFRNATFADTARFLKAEFTDEAFFGRATFVGDGDFRSAAFRGTVHFVETTFRSSATLRESTFERARFENVRTAGGDVTINLERTTVDGGRFVQENGAAVYYNLRRSRVGDVDIEMADSEGVFERFLFYRTEFDGFDFSNYRYVLAPEWVLHTFRGTVDDTYSLEADRFAIEDDADEAPGADGGAADKSGGGPGEPADGGGVRSRLAGWLADGEASDLEVTYLKAKNGAERVGDSQSASRFFIKEMYYRRRTHVDRAFAHKESLRSRLKLLFLVAVNLTLSATCGYGEKPRRTIGFSLVTVVVYAALFAAVVTDPPFASPLGYGLLSVQSFTSLIFGPTATVPNFAGSFLAATEGFVGAFMIGLFIFALTRSVHR